MKPSRLVLVALAGAGCLAAALAFRSRAGSADELERPPLAPDPAPGEALSVGRRAVFPAPRAAAAGSSEAPGSPWIELNNEATLTLAQGELERAVEMFERCRAAEPERAVFTGNLAEALVRLARQEHDHGELARAVEHLARAIELAPAREDVEVLRQVLARWRTELEIQEDDWTERSDRFDLSYDTRRQDLLHRSYEVLEHLELAYDDLRAWFGEDPFGNGPPIQVVLYDREEFDRLTGLGDWAGGVFDGVVRVSVEDLSAEGARWRRILVHELVHVFVQGLGGEEVPGWLNEGLAQLFEARPGALEEARTALAGKELFPLAELAGSLLAWQEPGAIARAYAESLSFVDYLRANQGEEVLRRMVLACREGGGPAEAFSRWSSIPLATAFEDWQASLLR